MALRIADVPALHPVEDPADDGAIVELRGVELRGSPAASPAQLLEATPDDAETLVEIIRLRTELADRDRRIAALTSGLRVWRDRATAEAAARRSEQAEAHDREREVVSLLHQQMQLAESATAELERLRSRSWWQRLRG